MISSVLSAMMSSGMSSHVSSGGASRLTSMAPSADVGAEEPVSPGFFSLLEGGFPGGGAEDIVGGKNSKLYNMYAYASKQRQIHSTHLAMAENTTPSADDKARYETLKKELMQALPKKRAIDKQLACLEICKLTHTHLTTYRHKSKFKYTIWKLPTWLKQRRIAGETSSKDSRTI